MKCSERHLVSGYLDDALSPRQKAGVLAHLEQCSECAKTLARYRQMELLLRRLPARDPAPEARDKMLRRLPAAHPRHWQWHRGVAAAALLLLTAIGVSVSTQTLFAPLGTRALASGPTATAMSMEGTSAAWSAPVEVSHDYGSDVALLRQVSRSVRRPGFRPLLPGYLPKGAKLTNVNLRPNNPGGPIDQLEAAFVTTSNPLQMRQESADAASLETQRMLRGSSARLLTAGGHEWLYIRGDAEDRNAPAVLIGTRDGIVIRLESSLPLEELEKIAASLQD